MLYIHLYGGNQFCILMLPFSDGEGICTILFLFHTYWLYICNMLQFRYLFIVFITHFSVYLAFFGYIVQVYLDIMYTFIFSMWLFAYVCVIHFAPHPASFQNQTSWHQLKYEAAKLQEVQLPPPQKLQLLTKSQRKLLLMTLLLPPFPTNNLHPPQFDPLNDLHRYFWWVLPFISYSYV